jgi:hypothetical protein
MEAECAEHGAKRKPLPVKREVSHPSFSAWLGSDEVSRSSPSGHTAKESQHKEHQEDEEENLRNFVRKTGNQTESEKPGDECHD